MAVTAAMGDLSSRDVGGAGKGDGDDAPAGNHGEGRGRNKAHETADGVHLARPQANARSGAKVSALEKLISDEPEAGIERPHPLLANRLYTKVGQNRLFEVRPGVLHFGGFKPGQPHRQVVRVVNLTSTMQSMNIIGTTTPYFKVSCRKGNLKVGAVAPGMAEELFVEFTPTEWRYYCDCIRVHNDDENLVIPIHAYPTMAEAFFPKHLDFGRCQLGERHSRTVKLHSSIPVQFEFRVEILQPLPEVSVEPLEGIIPPNGGSASITVHFLPARLSTYSAQIRVSLSQFNSKPVVCTVTGSGFPGLNRPAALSANLHANLDTAAAAAAAAADPDGSEPTPAAVLQRAERKIQGQRMRANAKRRGHAPATAATAPAPATAGETSRLNVHNTGALDELLATEGLEDAAVRLGTNLYAHGKVSSVLAAEDTHADGRPKLPRRNGPAAAAAAAAAAATTRGASPGGETTYGVDPLGDVRVYDDENVSEEVKRALFEAQLARFFSNEKSKGLSIRENVGERAMDDAELEAVVRERNALAGERGRRLLEDAVNRREAEVGRAMVTCGERASLSSYEPLFNKFDSDKGALKARVLQRFRAAVNTVIVQVRTVNRFRRIRELLGPPGAPGAGPPRRQQHEEQGRQQRLSRLASAAVEPPRALVDAFPYSRQGDGDGLAGLSPVQLCAVADPDAAEPLEAGEAQRYRLMGYEPQAFDAVDVSAPPPAPAALLVGAAEESPSLLRDTPGIAAADAQGSQPWAQASSAPRAPSPRAPPPPAPEIKITDGSLMTIPPRRGVDEGYLLSVSDGDDLGPRGGGGASEAWRRRRRRQQQKQQQHVTSVSEPCWLNSVASTAGRPVLSGIWWPHIEPWFEMPRLPPLMDGPADGDESPPSPSHRHRHRHRHRKEEDEAGKGPRLGDACAGAQEVPTLEAVRELFGLPALLGPVGGAGGEVAAAVRGETNASLIQRLDRTLLDVRARQLEEVIERKKKVNGLLKDPALLIS